MPPDEWPDMRFPFPDEQPPPRQRKPRNFIAYLIIVAAATLPVLATVAIAAVALVVGTARSSSIALGAVLSLAFTAPLMLICALICCGILALLRLWPWFRRRPTALQALPLTLPMIAYLVIVIGSAYSTK